MWRSVAAVLVLAALCGCRQDMHNQPKYQPLERSAFFDDERAARPLVPGTVARGHLDDDPVLVTGKSGGTFVETLPMAITRELLARGHERYDIYCSPCHDRVGTGSGMIVQRGYKRPPSFHTDRLRELPSGYLYNAITNGFGQMPAYAKQVPLDDRWAIVAYVRALQRSQHAALADVPAAERESLEGADE